MMKKGFGIPRPGSLAKPVQETNTHARTHTLTIEGSIFSFYYLCSERSEGGVFSPFLNAKWMAHLELAPVDPSHSKPKTPMKSPLFEHEARQMTRPPSAYRTEICRGFLAKTSARSFASVGHSRVSKRSSLQKGQTAWRLYARGRFSMPRRRSCRQHATLDFWLRRTVPRCPNSALQSTRTNAPPAQRIARVRMTELVTCL